ncbi:PACE efflux transporter [Kordiimonas sp. SCSIO 12603]|uniref:PACE efflux transporter n=1 Tax=Kordiimonas sp. SCSIO 12603 TaxID=2829596 RepID=UPI00210605D6|nr:PACE efflux transporter [Kordiimonas sp. SCSIO 12603]UTW59799.1 PACE efflux transporter [Kordiimonas sp. SCSIO 12603]
MSVKERLFHMVLFEAIALLLFIPLAMLATGEGAGAMAGLSIGLSLIAMLMNFLYNWGFDIVFGHERIKRTVKIRILHTVGFEVAMIISSFPLIMYVLDKDFLTVLLLDIGGVAFFLVYAFIFNWVYDVVRHRMVTREAT